MHVVWHRTELRVHDHPALAAAAASGEPVVPLVIIDPIIFGRPTTTPRRQAWFLENTRLLRDGYRALGGDLVVREGRPADVLADFVRRHPSVRHVHFIQNHTPYAKERDAESERALNEAGVAVHTYPGQYTQPPGTIRAGDGSRYVVFAAFKRRWDALPGPSLADVPKRLPPLPPDIAPGDLRRVESEIPLPPPGEAAALGQLERFLAEGEANYERARDLPAAEPGTSRLSYYCNIGALSPRVAVRRARTAKWRFELAWWDFFADVLDRCPESASQEYRPEWRGFPWRYNDDETAAWREGRTGFPIVDAGMRELRETGFLHNRVRLITASFLTKHLLMDWRIGEAVFRGWLLCGDTSQNVGNWQWVAGCGVDPAPYFRVFNPVTQGERYDPDGAYVRRWVPELADLPAEHIHRPWQAKTPPTNYPPPMIDLAFGRERFLETAQRHLKRDKP